MASEKDEDYRSAAVLTLKDAGFWSDDGRREIAAWIRRQADQLEEHGSEYGKGRYIARYLYRETA